MLRCLVLQASDLRTAPRAPEPTLIKSFQGARSNTQRRKVWAFVQRSNDPIADRRRRRKEARSADYQSLSPSRISEYFLFSVMSIVLASHGWCWFNLLRCAKPWLLGFSCLRGGGCFFLTLSFCPSPPLSLRSGFFLGLS